MKYAIILLIFLFQLKTDFIIVKNIQRISLVFVFEKNYFLLNRVSSICQKYMSNICKIII